MSPRTSFPALVGRVVNSVKSLEPCFSVSEIDVMEAGLQFAVAKLRGMRNLVQPINRLPPELLSQIFSETQLRLPSFLPALQFNDMNYNWQEWMLLLTVCRHWRGIIASVPALWSNVCSSAYALQFLNRSRGVDLSVYIGLRIGLEPIPPSLMDALAPHTMRIKELHVLPTYEGDQEGILNHQLFAAKAPRLKSLTLELERREDLSHVLPPIFHEHMPKLRQLALSYFTSWPKHYFHNLTSLCLYNQKEDSFPPTTEFLDFLESSPRMVALALVRAGPCRPLGSDIDPAGRIVSLKRLQKLDIGEWSSASIIARFLAHLSLPRKTDMYFWGDFLRDHEDVGSILPEDTSLLPNLRRPKELFFVRQTQQIYPSFKLIAIADSGLYLTGTLLPSQMGPSAMSRYPLSKVEYLKIREDATQFRRLRVSEWKSILGLVPGLRSLDIVAAESPQCTRSVLSALRPPKLFPPLLPSVEDVLCSNLQAIEFTEELDLPFLHICNVTAERVMFGAPEIKFTVRGSLPSRPAPQRRRSYDSDSDTDLEHGFESFGTETHMQSVEYAKLTEMVRIGPIEWPTRPFNWYYNRRSSPAFLV